MKEEIEELDMETREPIQGLTEPPKQMTYSEFMKDINTTPKTCPTCGSNVRKYKRKLNIDLCLALMEIYKFYRYHESQPDLIDFTDATVIFKNNPRFLAIFKQLLYWDLIEHQQVPVIVGKKNPKEVLKKIPNMYRLSENGIKFCQREIGVPSTAVLYKGQVIAHILTAVTLEQILEEYGVVYDELVSPEFQIV